ncbi:MAG: hypothetical protein C4525_04360 [Desulfarculus sp.]|jgi:lipopolysaccharide/colanic/teichoic acid biosynthesis glycosyltransferase|nr:MAG: hypothetical protein C4525_04360 [Desulfarculus sp.]
MSEVNREIESSHGREDFVSSGLKEKIPLPCLKRALDLSFSLLLLLAVSPLFILILLAIFLEHLLLGRPWAPLFYAEPRMSQGRQFHFLKFNIFKPQVIEALHEKGVFIHTKYLEWDGTSMTRVGRILQRVYLDELPQMLNVLRGDLSLVGPRPVNLEVYEEALKRGVTNWQILRSGLTGPYQSHKGQGLGRWDQYRLDQEYANFLRSHSGWEVLCLDLGIIARTLRVLAKAQGL